MRSAAVENRSRDRDRRGSGRRRSRTPAPSSTAQPPPRRPARRRRGSPGRRCALRRGCVSGISSVPGNGATRSTRRARRRDLKQPGLVGDRQRGARRARLEVARGRRSRSSPGSPRERWPRPWQGVQRARGPEPSVSSRKLASTSTPPASPPASASASRAPSAASRPSAPVGPLQRQAHVDAAASLDSSALLRVAATAGRQRSSAIETPRRRR